MLRKKLMAETNPNNFEVFIELIRFNDIAQGSLDDFRNTVTDVISASGKDNSAVGQQFLQRWSLIVNYLQYLPVLIVVEVAKEESRSVQVRLQDVVCLSIGYDTDFILWSIYYRKVKYISASLVIISYLILHLQFLETLSQFFKIWALFNRNLHKESILMVNAMIVNHQVHDVTSPGSVQWMMGGGIVNKIFIELYGIVKLLCDVGRSYPWKMVKDECSHRQDS